MSICAGGCSDREDNPPVEWPPKDSVEVKEPNDTTTVAAYDPLEGESIINVADPETAIVGKWLMIANNETYDHTFQKADEDRRYVSTNEDERSVEFTADRYFVRNKCYMGYSEPANFYPMVYAINSDSLYHRYEVSDQIRHVYEFAFYTNNKLKFKRAYGFIEFKMPGVDTFIFQKQD